MSTGKRGPARINRGPSSPPPIGVATVEDERDPTTGQRRQVELRAKTKAAGIEKVKEHRKRLDAGVRR